MSKRGLGQIFSDLRVNVNEEIIGYDMGWSMLLRILKGVHKHDSYHDTAHSRPGCGPRMTLLH